MYSVARKFKTKKINGKKNSLKNTAMPIQLGVLLASGISRIQDLSAVANLHRSRWSIRRPFFFRIVILRGHSHLEARVAKPQREVLGTSEELRICIYILIDEV